MKYIDLFAGIGGFRLGIGTKGECVYTNEWDKYAAQIYEKNFKAKVDTRSIVDVPAESIPGHDLICGGFPCQSFSIAGKRGGFNDTRGTLFFEIMRIARAKGTKYLFLENVKGLLSHDGGRTFDTIIRTIDELGYDCQWQVLNSKNFGVPQNRERVYIVGHLRGEPRPKVFPIGESSQQNESKGIFAHTLNSSDWRGGNRNQKQTTIMQLNKPKHSNDRIYGKDGISPTLNTAQGGRRQPFVLDKNLNNMVSYQHGEESKLDDGALEGKTKLRKEKEQMLNLQGKEKDGDTPQKRGLARQSDRKPTGSMPKLPYQNPQEKTTMQSGGLQPDTQEKRILRQAQSKVQEIRKSPDVQTQSIQPDYRIRRLTPLEAERLQGFPDDWTESVSDTQRYKMLGNAVTVNVIEAIVGRFLI